MTINREIDRALYGVAQIARIGWHTGHYALGRRLMGPLAAPGHAPPADDASPLDRRRLSQSFRELFAAEARHIREGTYKRPAETRRAPAPHRLFAQSRDYLRDVDAVARRKAGGGRREIFAEPHKGAYPDYYLQNFHFQTDGWLSEASAARYDMQVETLFTGAGGAMRRLALPFLRKAIDGRDPAQLSLVDLGCGGAPLLADVLDNWPTLRAAGIDLSSAYLGMAQRRLAPYRHASLLKANAEATGLESGSVDIALAVFLFHELPSAARARVAAEAGRLVRPGGTFILVDTIQYGDEPGLDALLENFPRAFHEPYYDGYCRSDLAGLMAPGGFTLIGETVGFLSKASCYRRNVD